MTNDKWKMANGKSDSISRPISQRFGLQQTQLAGARDGFGASLDL